MQADCRDGGELTVRPVKGQQRGQVDIAHPIAVCHHEGVRQPGTQAQDPPAGHGRVARVDDADLPVRAVRLNHPPRAIVQIHEVIAVAHVVSVDVLLDHLALIAAGDDDWHNPEGFEFNIEQQAVRAYGILCTENTIPGELRILNGGHDSGVWKPAFSEGLK